jgi:hypothetical protein
MQDELDLLNIVVVVVTFEAGFLARAYVEETSLTWPLLVDEERTLYRRFDMLSAGFWDVWGPATWMAYGREMLRGRLPKASSGSTDQRGGNVLVDPRGLVRIHHISSGPADRPRPASFTEFVRDAEGG